MFCDCRWDTFKWERSVYFAYKEYYLEYNTFEYYCT